MIHQPIKAAFADDPDAQRAVVAVGRRVAEYADLTRRLAHGQFPSAQARDNFRRHVIERRDIIVSRARSAGIVDHEMETFWEAARAHAAQLVGRKLDIYAIPSFADSVVAERDKSRRKRFSGRAKG